VRQYIDEQLIEPTNTTDSLSNQLFIEFY